MADFPPCPASLKQIQHFLKIAQEHDTRDIVVCYWSRLYALQVGLKASTQKPDETKLLLSVMDWLEATKKQNSDNEAITNEVAAQAHMENYALKLFLYADKQDRESNFGKNVVKAFYTCGVLYDVMQAFGELTEEAQHNRKYAKWKAAYIHNCLKNGETPIPGPMSEDGDGNDEMGGEPSSPPPPPASGSGDVSPTESQSHSQLPDEPTPSTSEPPPTAEEVLSNPNKLPSPPVDEEKPGGFVAYIPEQPAAHQAANVHITPEQMLKAQKYCKYAGSALNYDDVKSAIENLQNALRLLTTGQDV